MKLFRNTLIDKDVVEHKNQRNWGRGKKGKKRHTLYIYVRAYVRGRLKIVYACSVLNIFQGPLTHLYIVLFIGISVRKGYQRAKLPFYTLFSHMGRLAGRPCFIAFSTQHNLILRKRKIAIGSNQQVCCQLPTSLLIAANSSVDCCQHLIMVRIKLVFSTCKR